MSDTYPVGNLVFGDIKMHETIADISDIALLLKANDTYTNGGITTASLPTGSDLVLNTVVQLTEKVSGQDGDGKEFVAGHYYQYTNSKGSPAWYDITDGVTKIKHSGYGYFYEIDDSHIKCIWSDPVTDEDENGWIGSDLYLVHEGTDGVAQYELLYSETKFYEVAGKDGIVIEISDNFDSKNCAFVVRYRFEDTSSYSSITLAPVTSLEMANANRVRAQIKLLLGGQTEKIVVKDSTFTDYYASVHVFSNGIFSGPDGLMMPTDKGVSGVDNFHGIFFRQKDTNGEFVYSNKAMMANSLNLPVYDDINDRYILSGTGGVFTGAPSGNQRLIAWTRYNHSVFNAGSNCPPSWFRVNYNSETKGISLIGKAASRDGGAGWYGITADGVRKERPASVIITNRVITCNPSGGIEYSEDLIPQMFSASPSGRLITWSTTMPECVYTHLSKWVVAYAHVIFASNTDRIDMSTDGKTWHEFDFGQEYYPNPEVFITDEGRAIVSIGSNLLCSTPLNSDTFFGRKNYSIAPANGLTSGNWRTPVKISKSPNTYYVTTDTTHGNRLAVSVDGVSWAVIDSIFFGDNAGSALIDNPVVNGSDIYFPTTDGINYIRKMPLDEFFNAVTMARMASRNQEFTDEEVRSRLAECMSVMNSIRRLVNA